MKLGMGCDSFSGLVFLQKKRVHMDWKMNRDSAVHGSTAYFIMDFVLRL